MRTVKYFHQTILIFRWLAKRMGWTKRKTGKEFKAGDNFCCNFQFLYHVHSCRIKNSFQRNQTQFHQIMLSAAAKLCVRVRLWPRWRRRLTQKRVVFTKRSNPKKVVSSPSTKHHHRDFLTVYMQKLVYFSLLQHLQKWKKVSSTTTALTAHVKQEVVTADSKIQMLARCKTNLFSAESSLICKFNLEWS